MNSKQLFNRMKAQKCALQALRDAKDNDEKERVEEALLLLGQHRLGSDISDLSESAAGALDKMSDPDENPPPKPPSKRNRPKLDSAPENDLDEEEAAESPPLKQARAAFDAASMLTTLKSMVPEADNNTEDSHPNNALLQTYLDRGIIDSRLRSFREPLIEGAFIETALDLGHDWAWIGAQLGMTNTDPARSTRVQHARFIYYLVTEKMPRLRHVRPTDACTIPRLRGHIRPLKRFLEDMPDADLAWWRQGEAEKPPMQKTYSHAGAAAEVQYVDPAWLLP